MNKVVLSIMNFNDIKKEVSERWKVDFIQSFAVMNTMRVCNGNNLQNIHDSLTTVNPLIGVFVLDDGITNVILIPIQPKIATLKALVRRDSNLKRFMLRIKQVLTFHKIKKHETKEKEN